jgi:2',3'-cyclic-nucleotide 2'-phosphodiesterase (5'-nucleotidase family)
MRHTLYWIAVILLLLPADLSAQKYTLKKLESSEIAITSRWDSSIPKEDVKFLAPYKARVDSVMKRVIGHSDVYMTDRRPESLLSNFISDVLLKSAVPFGGADMAVMNMGGLRSIMPKGDVTFGDVFEISPFENMYTIVTMRGSDVLALFSQMAGVGGEGISGATLVITSDGKLLDAKIQGRAVEPDATYRIATLDYLAEGNDKMEAFKLATKKTITTKTVRQVLIDFISNEEAHGRAITSKLEGRITVSDK